MSNLCHCCGENEAIHVNVSGTVGEKYWCEECCKYWKKRGYTITLVKEVVVFT